MKVLPLASVRALQEAARAFSRFPASLACAAAFTFVTMARIYLDWPREQSYQFLFSCLHWALGFGAVFSLAAVTFVQNRRQGKGLLAANLSGLAATAFAFAALYLWGDSTATIAQGSLKELSDVAAARMGAATAVSLLIFVIVAAAPKEGSDIARSLFMVHKGLVIAILYGLVLAAGLAGVAGAIQALLYQEMSYKVYSYIAAGAAFLAYAVFLGFFPDFGTSEEGERRKVAEQQPRFIEILFGRIMVPVMLALTIVLLAWTGRIALQGNWPSFERLAGIAASYTLVGVWLHLMVTYQQTGAAVLYRRIYPFAALFILVFEAWALYVRLERFGLKTTEYCFVLTWLFGVFAAILLVRGGKAEHLKLAAAACFLLIFSVLPLAGYHSLPVKAQTARLQKILAAEKILVNGSLQPAGGELSLQSREDITDAVAFLSYERGAELPAWFDKGLVNGEIFQKRLGFAQVWPKDADAYAPGRVYLGTHLYLSSEPLKITGYDWMLKPQRFKAEVEIWGDIAGSRGIYRLRWLQPGPEGVPAVEVSLDGRLVLEKNLKDYIEGLKSSYPPATEKTRHVSPSVMSLTLAAPEIELLLLFEEIHVNLDNRDGKEVYTVVPAGVYLREK